MQQNRGRWRFTPNAAALLFVLGAMWYAASSQQNAAVYLLLFTLTSAALVSVPHTIANVGGLTGRAEAIKPAFAGQEAALPVEITNQSRKTRRGIRLQLPNVSDVYEELGEIPAGKAIRGTLRFATTARGEHEIKAVCLLTTYPIGLLHVTKPLAVMQRYIVYPKPAGDPKLPNDNGKPSPERLGAGDDFAGVRAYIPGESQRHIDWKAVARGQALMTKQFTADVESGDLYLDFAAVRSRHLEDRLSQLALWIIEGERARRAYGLRLPNMEIAPSLGDAHFHKCLRALALFK